MEKKIAKMKEGAVAWTWASVAVSLLALADTFVSIWVAIVMCGVTVMMWRVYLQMREEQDEKNRELFDRQEDML